MKIPVECGNCKKQFQVDEKFIGKKWKCPNCSEIISVEKKEVPRNAKVNKEEKKSYNKSILWTGLAIIIWLLLGPWLSTYNHIHAKKVAPYLKVHNQNALIIWQTLTEIQSWIPWVHLTNAIQASNNMLDKGCPKLKKAKESCTELYTSLRTVLNLMEDGEYDKVIEHTQELSASWIQEKHTKNLAKDWIELQ